MTNSKPFGVLDESRVDRVAMGFAVDIGAKAFVKSTMTGGVGESPGNAVWPALAEASSLSRGSL